MDTNGQIVGYIIVLAFVCALAFAGIRIVESFEARHAAPTAVQIDCLDGVEYYVMPDGNIAPRFTDAGLVLCGPPVVDPAVPVRPQSYTY